VISDVIGNKLDVIGSGPTVPDTSTFMDAYSVLESHGILEKVPKAVKNHIMEGCGGRREENPKKLENTDNYVIGDNASALDAMALAAKNLGYNPLIMTLGLTGEPETAAKQLIEDAYSKKYLRKTAIICGGETYPKLPDKRGKGGRNLHFTASVLKHLKGKEFTFISINSDGSDFESEAAGAIIDSQDNAKALKLNLDVDDYLKKYDTYNFFNKLEGSIIKTGRTGTNVADLMLLLKK
jgi:glycerate 2-kinase